ncbi:MAG: HAMP domain-containing protein [Sedimentisphaerales bacterium]|nr:HAMP domain-containing protein [Sedimentisphaerales bacterium]
MSKSPEKITNREAGIGQIVATVSRNMTIRHKLVFMIMAACVVSLVVAGAIFTGYEWANLRQFMVMNLSAQAEILADNCKAAVAFNDSEDAKEVLSSLRVESSIVFGGIYTKDGKLMSAYYKVGTDKSVQPERLKEDGYEFSGGYVTVFKRIILDGEVLGTVCIRSSLEKIWTMLWSRIKITFAVIIVSLVAAYVISSKLQSVVSKPLLKLAKLAKAISDEKDYSVRGQKTSNDEIGSLIDAFNEMLNQIQRRDKALVDANRQLEAKVAERTSDLEQTIEKLNESNKQLQDFTYVASHDLREPLRKISSFGQLLTESLGEKLTDDDRENLSYMIDGASRMQQMIEALLTYSRVTTRGVDFEPTDLNQVVEGLKNFELSVVLEETNTKLIVEKPLHTVNCDSTQIRQLLQNLIANGLKYQKKGVTPEITIRSKTVDDSMVRVEVQDNGIGIKEDQFENIFVMFRRLHSRQEYEGTGIGLAVCKKIVKRHGGDIGVSSTYGEGSTFWFTAPVADSSRAAVLAARENENEV